MSELTQEMFGAALRPQSWDNYVGQAAAKRELRIAARSAKARDARLGHTLIFSPDPGVGKTSLALLLASEMGVGVEIVSGQMKVDEVRMTVTRLADHDILVLEEIHRLFDGGKRNAEWLLHVMEDGVLVGPLGPEEIPDITIVGTTTDIGRISGTILDRFVHKPRLVPYTLQEATMIATLMSGQLFPQDIELPSDETFEAIAKAAACRPRVMRAMLEKLLDLAVVGDLDGSDPDYDLTEVLDWQGVTPDGLPTLAQEYLLVLLDTPGGMAGLPQLTARMGVDKAALEDPERLLERMGYIKRTSRGRALTADGIKRARALRTELAA